MSPEVCPCGRCEGRGCDECVTGTICMHCGYGVSAVGDACECEEGVECTESEAA